LKLRLRMAADGYVMDTRLTGRQSAVNMMAVPELGSLVSTMIAEAADGTDFVYGAVAAPGTHIHSLYV
jgi:nucleoside permease NupC